MNLVVVAIGAAGPLITVVKLFEFWDQVDRTLRHLHDVYPEIWTSVGSPTGWAWAPKGRIGTPFSMNVEWFKWQDGQEPDWLQTVDPDFVGQLMDLRSKGRSLNWFFGAFLVGGAIVMLGLAIN